MVKMMVIQVVATTGALALIGYLIKRFAWARTITKFACQAYLFAEEKGILDGLKGFDKLKPFMDKLVKLIEGELGREATPKDKALAVREMEKLVWQEKIKINFK